MKVLFVSFPGISLLTGGVKVQVLSLKAVLEKAGVTVELFDPWKEYQLKNFDIIHLFSAHSGTYHLSRILKDLGERIVVTPIFYSRYSPSGLSFLIKLETFLNRITKQKILTEHLLIKQILSDALAILPNTKEEAILINQGFGVPNQKIKILPNGVDERFYYATPDLFIREYQIKDFILYVGPIGWGRKNLLKLLKVLQRIERPAVLLGPVFNNDYAKKCLEIAKNNQRILIIPETEHDSPLLESAYSACEVFVLPSYFETPGLSALEAGLAGAKIVITKYGGTKEYFEDYVEYINPKKEKSIYQGLLRALKKPKETRLREHIKMNFLWEKSGSELLKIYQTILTLI